MGRKPKNSTITEPTSPNSVPEDANVLQKAAEIEDLIAALMLSSALGPTNLESACSV